jgi:hypothetical protein
VDHSSAATRQVGRDRIARQIVPAEYEFVIRIWFDAQRPNREGAPTATPTRRYFGVSTRSRDCQTDDQVPL